MAACLALFACSACGGDHAAAPNSGSGAPGGASAGGSAAASGGFATSSAGASSGGGGVTSSAAGSGGKPTAVGGTGGTTSVAGSATAGAGGSATAGAAGSATAGAAGSAMAGAAGLGGMAGAGGADAGKIVLFDGNDLSLWKAHDGDGPAPWNVSEGAIDVVPGSGDIVTRQAFGDIQLHVEFWIPKTPATNDEQDRGNSGVYLQGRYEVQVLDSYMHPLDGANDCGAIYEVKNADVNAALPPENWQTYDITFYAPRWSGTTKTANAKISVIWNGQQAQKDTEVPAPTRLGDPEAPGDAPLRLQDHNHAVRYRNVWARKL